MKTTFGGGAAARSSSPRERNASVAAIRKNAFMGKRELEPRGRIPVPHAVRCNVAPASKPQRIRPYPGKRVVAESGIIGHPGGGIGQDLELLPVKHVVHV